MKLKRILVVDAVNMPAKVLDYCVENEISTHYQHDATIIEDDGNPFAEWLKSEGYEFSGEKYGDYVAIIAT